jgi:hypothetical protein
MMDQNTKKLETTCRHFQASKFCRPAFTHKAHDIGHMPLIITRMRVGFGHSETSRHSLMVHTHYMSLHLCASMGSPCFSDNAETFSAAGLSGDLAAPHHS